MTKAIQFFATRSDLREVLHLVEGRSRLQFVQAGRFNSSSPVVFHGSENLPNLGIASHDSSAICHSYLVSEEGSPICVEELPSAPFFAFDQLLNPKTVAFKPGGIWKGEMLIRGSVGTASADPESLKLMKIFGAALRKKFASVRGILVGAGAEQLWKQGKRLTGAEQSPVEFDLAPEEKQ